MIKGPKKTVTVTLSLELYLFLKKTAEESGRSLPGYIRQIIKLYVRHLDDGPDPLRGWWEGK